MATSSSINTELLNLNFISFFCLCVILLSGSGGVCESVPGLYVFGDSLVDVGNNNHLTLSLAKADFPHNGVDFPTGKATGRFSNGKNAADFLAEKVGLPSAPPYLSLVSKSKKLSSTNATVTGISFASGGAGIFNGTDELFVSLHVENPNRITEFNNSSMKTLYPMDPYGRDELFVRLDIEKTIRITECNNSSMKTLFPVDPYGRDELFVRLHVVKTKRITEFNDSSMKSLSPMDTYGRDVQITC